MTTNEPDRAGTPLHHAETADDVDPDATRADLPSAGPAGDPEEPDEDPHARRTSGEAGAAPHRRDTADRIDPTGRG